MIARHLAALTLLLSLGACAAADDTPSAWEIVHGPAALVASKALHPSSGAVLGDFPSRTGSLTIHDDSTVTGWIALALGDTVAFAGGTTGTLTGTADLVVTLPGLTPSAYAVITRGDFPDTYGLVSTVPVSGGDVVASHKVYWEFHK